MLPQCEISSHVDIIQAREISISVKFTLASKFYAKQISFVFSEKCARARARRFLISQSIVHMCNKEYKWICSLK